jgi:Family of unknown function (DUF6069)
MTVLETRTQSPTGRVRYRLLAMVLGVAAAIIVWVVASLMGIQLEVTSPLVGTLEINLPLVIISALPLALAAWGVLALFERFTPRARRIWTIVAIGVLVLSVPPLALLDATVATKIALAFMHLATGVTLILLLRWGARTS